MPEIPSAFSSPLTPAEGFSPFGLAAVFVVPRDDLNHVDVLPGVGHGPQLADDLVDVRDLHGVEPQQRLCRFDWVFRLRWVRLRLFGCGISFLPVV